MIETRDSLRRARRALLAGVLVRGGDEHAAQSLLDELGELAATLGLDTAESILVRVSGLQAAHLVGLGKAEELAARAKALGAEVIVFDNELSPGQQRNLEKLSGLAVIDREEVILEIFGRRAQTREARLQVELARLQYSLPRLTRAWAHLGRMGGGIGARGEGETQLETDRRIIRQRIDRAKRELKEVRGHRATQRKARARREIPVAAIVGYTNAGKSSLLKRLTGAEVLIEDKLFATLDTTTRQILLPNGRPLLLTDTVGFVRRLPHGLVEAFKATLEEAAQADFLVHLLDVTNPEIFEMRRTTLEVLQELGAADKPTLTAFNKTDLDPDAAQRAMIRQHVPAALFVSTRTGEGMDELLARLADLAGADIAQVEVEIPHARYDLVSRLHAIGKVISESALPEGVRAVARVPRRFLPLYQPYLVPEPPAKSSRRKSRGKVPAA